MPYEYISTDFDVMKEELVQGAYFDGIYNMPVLPPVDVIPYETITFSHSLKEKSGNRKDNISFYEDDFRFAKLWNSPFRYIEHLKKFESVCMPDFTLSIYVPLPINIWNNYRNHALAYWMATNGITVIPDANILPEQFQNWCWDGLPTESTLCASTVGRVRKKEDRLNFCRWFNQMELKLSPERVILYGSEIKELEPRCEIVYMKQRSVQIDNEMVSELSQSGFTHTRKIRCKNAQK